MSIKTFAGLKLLKPRGLRLTMTDGHSSSHFNSLRQNSLSAEKARGQQANGNENDTPNYQNERTVDLTGSLGGTKGYRQEWKQESRNSQNAVYS